MADIKKLGNTYNNWEELEDKTNEIIDNGGGGGGGGFTPTQEQLDAMNSGATVAKINQIGTNTMAISNKANSNDVYTKAQADTLLADKVDKETNKSLVSNTDITQITTNKNDIIVLKSKKVITEVNSLPATGNPDTFYRVITNSS